MSSNTEYSPQFHSTARLWLYSLHGEILNLLDDNSLVNNELRIYRHFPLNTDRVVLNSLKKSAPGARTPLEIVLKQQDGRKEVWMTPRTLRPTTTITGFDVYETGLRGGVTSQDVVPAHGFGVSFTRRNVEGFTFDQGRQKLESLGRVTTLAIISTALPRSFGVR